MAYIKKLVMHGFKSFVRKTELPFTPGINVIVGPNGSGKSNLSDALCFVLGRLSVKSMRAAKAGNLIFLGSKSVSSAKEASVEIIFDNSDKMFSFDKKEISIKRVVRKNGQSTYKIDNEIKTRQEVLTLLAQAGVDPNGFNIILQGEIQNFTRMHTEERRKIIEEVSGVSVYESRKEKSIRELEKTDDKIREVAAILRERTAYLRNLEIERQQALKFKKLESDVKKLKASIIYSDIEKNKKYAGELAFQIEKKFKEIDKLKKDAIEMQSSIRSFEEKVISINQSIQKSTGLEQENLNQEIANLRADLAGLEVRLENYEAKFSEISKQKQQLKDALKENEESLAELQKSPEGKINSKLKEKEIEKKKKELERLENQRKQFYMVKSELKSIKERIDDKKSTFQSCINESEFLLKQIKIISQGIFYKDCSANKLEGLKITLAEKRAILENLRKREIELEKTSYANECEIEKQKKLIERISKMDICPICKNRITEQHICSINADTISVINSLKDEIKDSDRELGEIYKKKDILNHDIEEIDIKISKMQSDLLKFSNAEEKKEQIKILGVKSDEMKGVISELEKKRRELEKEFDANSGIEKRYDLLRVEISEILLRTEENLDSELILKKREIERTKISINQMIRDESDLTEEIAKTGKLIKEKQESLDKKKEQDEKLTNQYKKLISERDEYQKKIREEELHLLSEKNHIYDIEQEMNNLKIEKAKFDAVIENLESEATEFSGVEIIKGKKEMLVERLEKTQETLLKIGSVNLRSLEVYDEVKKEYEAVNEKMEIIIKEKECILKIIEEIDIKKKRTFLKTLDSLNEIFSRNFSHLSMKGQVWLEIENKQNPFEAGVGIVVKTGHGKYFDVASLSGGEQTLVALSLIFAIQELNPYCFYILDEIDAALDKRNSERLAELLKKHMQKGQYIVITHNDEVISKATNIYGVSMHEGVSKIVSLSI